MDPHLAIEIARHSAHLVLFLAAPVLVVGVVVGIVVGLLQAMTQIQDPGILFAARLAAVIVVVSICTPWFVDHYCGFSRDLIEQIPGSVFQGSTHPQ